MLLFYGEKNSDKKCRYTIYIYIVFNMKLNLLIQFFFFTNVGKFDELVFRVKKFTTQRISCFELGKKQNKQN